MINVIGLIGLFVLLIECRVLLPQVPDVVNPPVPDNVDTDGQEEYLDNYEHDPEVSPGK
jgi:hypothetical protein